MNPEIKVWAPKEENLHRKIRKIKEINRRRLRITETASASRGFTRQFRIEGIPRHAPREFMQMAKRDILKLMRENRQTRVRMILNCEMTRKELFSESTQILNTFFHSETVENLEGTDESVIYDRSIQTIEERIQNFNQRGSNWRFQRVLSLDIHFTDFQPLRGSTFLPLPRKIASKEAVINMKNDDDQCFKWSVVRALNPVEKNSERITNELKDQSERLDWSGLKFPVKLDQIVIFEKLNPQISINVFGFEGDVYPLRLSKSKSEQTINLLLISDGEKQHYCLIKSLSRLLSSQMSKHDHANSFCLNCLNHFPNEEKLKIHEEYCLKDQAIRIEMPEEGSFISFIHHNRSIKVPFVVYADFEAFTEEISTCEPNDKKSFTQKYQRHRPSGFCYKIVCFDERYNQKPVLFRAESEDEDISAIFVEMLERDIKRIQEKLDFSKKMIFSLKDKDDFEKAEICWICQKEFGREKKVRDHCHFTGKYRGAPHVKCNLQFKKPKCTPVIFHNLSGYDAHLFVKNLGRTEGNINCIPNNEEKYISFSKDIVVGEYEKDGKKHEIKHEIRFLDSFKFMASSLEGLVGNLGLEKLIETRKEFGERVELLSRKGIYPYDYMNGIKKFSEEKLPPKEEFFSKLNDCNISDEDFDHAKRIWKEFGVKNLGEYHDLYLKSDVLLLADVFEEFRNVCLENYSLDPAWYYTSPGLSWDALLKYSGVKLELLTDPDILLLFEKGIRGGVSMILNRYGKANNKFMGDNFDPSRPSKYLAYLDANNLYGWAMMKPLPVGDFKWMRERELKNWEDTPCILEVDLEYPRKLHDLHNDYPLAPERLKIGGVEKLIPNLWDKEKYIVHHENLKLYLGLGLKVKKIHRGIKFREEPWMKPYIELNTRLGANGKNDFEKDFFKLMNNSVFGKTMENIRNRVDVKLVNNRGAAEKLSAKPNFEHLTIFDENLVAVHMKRTKLKFNKPVYCGMAILDISKSLMYDFHYGYILPKYGKNQKLLFTDTDSLCYGIETEDFFKDISGDVKDYFDTSNFPKDHPSEIPVGKNKKVPGMMKDEAGGRIIEEFVGLRAKLYSYRMFEGKEEKKCKGIKKSVVRKDISHEDYKECLFSKKPQMRKMNVIRSHGHEIFSETVNKIALSANDDKRIILEDRISTLSYGHYKI